MKNRVVLFGVTLILGVIFVPNILGASGGAMSAASSYAQQLGAAGMK